MNIALKRIFKTNEVLQFMPIEYKWNGISLVKKKKGVIILQKKSITSLQ